MNLRKAAAWAGCFCEQEFCIWPSHRLSGFAESGSFKSMEDTNPVLWANPRLLPWLLRELHALCTKFTHPRTAPVSGAATWDNPAQPNKSENGGTTVWRRESARTSSQSSVTAPVPGLSQPQQHELKPSSSIYFCVQQGGLIKSGCNEAGRAACRAIASSRRLVPARRRQAKRVRLGFWLTHF